MLSINNVESQIVKHIRATILDNVLDVYSGDRLVRHMTPEHVFAATRLPKGQSVRRQLAQATIDTFLHSDTFKFSEEIREEEFTADVLQELKVSLKSVKTESYVRIHFKDH
jgi:Zn-dependent oligopeptidase